MTVWDQDCINIVRLYGVFNAIVLMTVKDHDCISILRLSGVYNAISFFATISSKYPFFVSVLFSVKSLKCQQVRFYFANVHLAILWRKLECF